MTVGSFFDELDIVVGEFLEAVGAVEEACKTEFNHLEGRLGSEGVSLDTLVYRTRGYGRMAWAKMTTDAGRALTRTLVGLPSGTCPILGLDIVAMKDKVNLFALDLATTDLTEWQAWAVSALQDARLSIPDFVARPLPAFTEGTFSELALIGSIGDEPPAALLAPLRVVLDRVDTFARDGRPSRAARAALHRWIKAERSNRKEIGALGRIFGQSLANRFFEDFLFVAPPELELELELEREPALELELSL